MIFQPYDRILIKVSSVPHFLNFILNFSKPSIENLIFLLSSFGGPTNLFDLVANFRIFFFFLRKGTCQSLNFIFQTSFRVRKLKITFVSFCLFSSSFCIFLRSFSSLALCRCSFAISLCLMNDDLAASFRVFFFSPRNPEFLGGRLRLVITPRYIFSNVSRSSLGLKRPFETAGIRTRDLSIVRVRLPSALHPR